MSHTPTDPPAARKGPAGSKGDGVGPLFLLPVTNTTNASSSFLLLLVVVSRGLCLSVKT